MPLYQNTRSMRVKMILYSRFCLFFVASAARYLLGINGEISCDSPQYLEIGKTGIINCSFDEDFYGVLWYDPTDSGVNYPFCEYQNFVKDGPGYTSGEFDVHTNGSLIITNVSLDHEHIFKVAYIHYRDDRPVFIDIETLLIVKPIVPYPVIDQCGNIGNVCFTSTLKSSLRCSVDLARPAISLQLVSRTIDGDREIPGNASITVEGVGYTSGVVTKDTFKSFPDLVLLVCKASALPGILQNHESFLLAQNGDITISSKDVTTKYIERDSKFALNCVDAENGFVVWKKADYQEDRNSTILFYSVNIGEEIFKIFADDVTLGDNALLIFSRAKVKHSGFYFCLFGNGVRDSLTAYEVVVVVNPVPAYPIIDGCNHEQYCTLEAEQEGIVTCTITGIRPQVNLRLQAFRKEDAQAISFFNDHVTVTGNGESFDVTLTSAYIWNDKSRDRLTIECMVPASNGLIFHLTTKMDLLLVKRNFKPTDQEGIQSTPDSLFWIIPIIFVLIVILPVCGIFFIKYIQKFRGSETKTANKEETTTLLPMKCYDEATISDLKVTFLNHLKAKYKNWYDAVQPIPYIKDRLYCVDKVFVEGGIEFLDSVEGQGGRGVWANLETYENVFNALQVSSPRRILEGEPGYGKSTVSLQFAYDWCNPKAASALKDVEILILLRLRQLGGVSSIYKAIKRFILPQDTTISETDIEHILRSSKSVVVILDGFDEYPDKDSITITNVMAIIARQMFTDFEVVTTTRSSFLPKKYPPLTKRIRLTGFDDKARRYYIRKAVVGEDDEGVKLIEGYLENNPILSDLCQVPLLFVIFAHMTYESEQFRKLTSVTSFFRYMISCFHSHMRNKMDEENVRKYEMFETNHQNLDKLAFEAFSGQSQRIVWDKDEMRQLVGQEFYDQYIRIGMLVEEESVDIVDDPGTPITEHVQYKTEVRFYHKLFCEWYAAHYLTDYLQRNPTVDLDEFLRHLDPFDVQYLYRFACGINSDSAERIIDYLKNIDGGDKFAILCILEQTGKIENIKETIDQLCNEGVLISGHDTLLLQRSSMQLLEIAARNEIAVKKVYLHNCLQSVELTTPSIKTTSGLALTSRIPVKVLDVSLCNRDMAEDEAIDILQFASKCPVLEELRLYGSVPPQSFNVDSTLSTLKERDVKVWWRMFNNEPLYILNLQTGRWEREDNNEELTSAKFEKMRSEFKDNIPSQSDETFQKNEIKAIREDLRKEAEEQRKNNPA